MNTLDNKCQDCLTNFVDDKNKLFCGNCQKQFCKNCLNFFSENQFLFWTTAPENLTQLSYCNSCHEQVILPSLNNYQEKLELAKGVSILFKKQLNNPVLKQSKHKISMQNCSDKQECFIKLAYIAVEQGYNALLQMQIEPTKENIKGYTRLTWSASAFPALITATRHEEKLKSKEAPMPEIIAKGKKKKSKF